VADRSTSDRTDRLVAAPARQRDPPSGSSELAETLLDAVVDAIVVFDPETRQIGYVNRGTCELLGRGRDELIGQPVDRLLHPSEPRSLAGLIGPVMSSTQDASTVVLDYRAADGGAISVEVVIQSVDLPGGSGAIVAIARDMRERIEAQVRLQGLVQAEHARAAELSAVIRAMGEAVIVCSANGTITLTNPAGELLFPTVEERTFGDILDQLVDPDGSAPRLGKRAGPVELRTTADADRWVEISTYPVGGGSGPAVDDETIVVMRDVTEARRREVLRETFVGVLSHELRTPVTTIFAGAKLLASGTSKLDEETRRGILRDIHEEAERLQRLVEDVVALNRFGEDAGDVSLEPVLLHRVLSRVVKSEDGRWPGVNFRLEMPRKLPVVGADSTYVEQVVRNLVSNAAKYGGIGSTVSVEAEESHHEVVVRVLDDGPGFPPEERDRLFELYYRSPRTATSATGAGIGLFVCARLIAAMGGRIWAVLRPGGGAEFGFALGELVD
jgi:PAS domain S-box-containing protein